jgi:hypothetical protein
MINKIIIGGYAAIWLIFILCCIILYYRHKKLKSIYKDDLDLFYLFHDINGFIIKKHNKYDLTYGEITPKAIDNMKNI